MTGDPRAYASTIARQHAHTARLLGVDWIPVAPAGTTIDPSEAEDAPSARTPPTNTTNKTEALEELRERHAHESPILTMIEGWTNIVFGVGNPNADLMFVGEAPGADEDEQGEPFVGRAGQLLNKMIGAMGLAREDVYIANVLKVRPPNNRTPTFEEWQADGPYLQEQIRIIAPKAIVTLGKPAANYLLNTDAAMGRLRGAWHEFEGIPVMPTYHPAFLLRSYTPDNRAKVWSDLQMAMSKLR